MKTAEKFGPDEAPTPLATPRDVRRALARTLRRIEAGSLDHAKGQVLINGYGSLFKSMMELQDRVWLPRVKELWRERESAKQPQAEAH